MLLVIYNLIKTRRTKNRSKVPILKETQIFKIWLHSFLMIYSCRTSLTFDSNVRISRQINYKTGELPSCELSLHSDRATVFPVTWNVQPANLSSDQSVTDFVTCVQISGYLWEITLTDELAGRELSLTVWVISYCFTLQADNNLAQGRNARLTQWKEHLKKPRANNWSWTVTSTN